MALKAQKFKDATPDELSMTSDPKAPGAAAVYLYREEVTDNFNHYFSEYARIKILTADGLGRADVPVPGTANGHRPTIEARAIHPDGKITPLNASSNDAVQTRSDGTQYFTIPSATVGSILEYRWTLAVGDSAVSGVTPGQQEFQNSALASEIPFWNVQEDLFVHKEHFYYNPLTDEERNVIGNLSITRIVDGEIAHYILFSGHLPPGAQVQVSPKQDYTLDVMNVPAFVEEQHAPPIANVRYSVRFYFTPYVTPDSYWTAEGKRWSQAMDQAASVTQDLKAAAAQLTAGAANEDAKARRLYDAVQGLANTAFSTGRDPEDIEQLGERGHLRSAQAVWAAKSGAPNELATVYLALARAAGLNASAMSVNDRRWRLFDPGFLSLQQLPVLLVVLHLGTGDLFLDPGQKMAPYGELHWAHTLCGGLLQTSSGAVTSVTTPPNNIKEAVTARLADISLDATGGMTGTVKFLMSGPSALSWRQRNLTQGTQAIQTELERQLFSSMPPSVSGSIRQIHGLDTPNGYLEVVAQVSGKVAKADGKHLEVPAFFFTHDESVALATTKERTQPVSMQFAGQQVDDAVFHLPAGFTVASAPQNLQLPWPGRGALMVKAQAGAGVLDDKRIFAVSFVLLPLQEFPALQSFYQKVKEADQQTAVFAAGNAGGN
ncbi:MAG: hypothetical protein KGL64_02290 [Acidobacteriota bacterium]|nr:hypothetical protein [Acidobacteriota bacterium]